MHDLEGRVRVAQSASASGNDRKVCLDSNVDESEYSSDELYAGAKSGIRTTSDDRTVAFTRTSFTLRGRGTQGSFKLLPSAPLHQASL